MLSHHHHLYSAHGQVLGTWSLASPFSRFVFLAGCCMGPCLDTHGVHRPRYSPQLSIEGAHGTEGRFLTFVPYFLVYSFFEADLLILPQLTITFASYDLHRYSGSVLSFTIP